MANERAELLARALRYEVAADALAQSQAIDVRCIVTAVEHRCGRLVASKRAELAVSHALVASTRAELAVSQAELRSSFEKLQAAEDWNSQHLAEMQSMNVMDQTLVDHMPA